VLSSSFVNSFISLSFSKPIFGISASEILVGIVINPLRIMKEKKILPVEASSPGR